MCLVTRCENAHPPQRSKPYLLAELPAMYHCAVIGTCIDIQLLKKAAQRFELVQGVHSDYELHHRVVHAIGQHAGLSKFLNKLLNKQFDKTIKRYRKIQCRHDLLNAWQEDLKLGLYVDSFWAVMRHPLGQSVWSDAHGDIHMLTHQMAQEKLVDVYEVQALRQRCDDLQANNEKLQSRVLRQAEKITKLQNDYQSLKKSNVLVPQAQARAVDAPNVSDPKSCKKVVYLQSQVQKLEERQSSYEQDQLAWQKERTALQLEKHQLHAQVVQLSECVNDCPVGDLSDEVDDYNVLYVGGRPSSCARMRMIVEEEQGQFHYHDGGLDGNTANLDQMLKRADFVMCPVTCVSHDACLKVKRYCKRHEKLFIPLKSTGISAFSAGLGEGRKTCSNVQ
ncbi:MAG: DUF2325 domain-containing protein [Methylococcales bacterium]|jgi:hypothetical protein|nr:DUF2325 domain-containing protein [Methylococcales bacterium]MBT7444485.1 DUF2325 domain-containing protein [Methylococcales bacterium]